MLWDHMYPVNVTIDSRTKNYDMTTDMVKTCNNHTIY